jgi:hypothetical protein
MATEFDKNKQQTEETPKEEITPREINWNDSTNPITKDWITNIRQAEITFEEEARKNPQNLEKTYSEFEDFMYADYFSDELWKKYPLMSYVRHEWNNIVGVTVESLISKLEEEKSNNNFREEIPKAIEPTVLLVHPLISETPDNTLKKIIQTTKLTSQLFEIWEKFGNDGKQSLSDLFQKAIDFVRATNTHQIITLGKDLLSEIKPTIEPGHKIVNFILFSTLLENAQKYSPKGSIITVEISKRLDQIAKKHGDTKYNYYISVSDQGIGIPPKDQEQVLKNGQRGSNVGNIPGTGFGLSLVYELCNNQLTITSPLNPEAEKYKGTKIKAELYRF